MSSTAQADHPDQIRPDVWVTRPSKAMSSTESVSDVVDARDLQERVLPMVCATRKIGGIVADFIVQASFEDNDNASSDESGEVAGCEPFVERRRSLTDTTICLKPGTMAVAQKNESMVLDGCCLLGYGACWGIRDLQHPQRATAAMLSGLRSIRVAMPEEHGHGCFSLLSLGEKRSELVLYWMLQMWVQPSLCH